LKIPGFRRLYSGDFDPQYRGLLDKLSGTINTGIEVLYRVLNNNITFADNMAATIADVAVQVDASGAVIGTTSFKLNNTMQVQGVIVTMVTNNTDNTPPIGGVFATFTTNNTNNNNNLVITNVTGLAVNKKYTLRVIALN
jgi:hypothetical protein